MFQQIRFFIGDIKSLLGKSKARIIFIWLSRSFWGILVYRMERGLFLTLGRGWSVLRIIFIPVLNLIYAYSNCEIHYKADIGPGIKVMHPSVGIVVSGLSVIGKNLTLTGGNVIGAKEGTKQGEIIIGDNCTLGANAVILGPIKLGNNISVGAMSLVNRNADDNSILVGVPAVAKQRKTTEPAVSLAAGISPIPES